MPIILGEFDVTLTKPIEFHPGITLGILAPCHFQIEDYDITLSALKIVDAITFDYPDDYDTAKLTDLKICITRKVTDQQNKVSLSDQEKSEFERVLIKAIRQFIGVVMRKTNQWDIDIKHPVNSYSPSYSIDDIPITVTFPLKKGHQRMPEYAHGRFSISASDRYSDITEDDWEEITRDLKSGVTLLPYEEILYDAKTFRSIMRYDVAALLAGIAIELVLENVCTKLLKTNRNLSQKECEACLKNKGLDSLIKLVKQLDHTLVLDIEALTKVRNLRNKIAHGEQLEVTSAEANKAIRTAEQLLNNLRSILAAQESI